MDVAWFLNQRLDFIRQLYARSSEPFVERRAKIENEEEQFVPPYSEDPEPAFMVEWQEANDSIYVLGHACLCMLASALQAYLQTRVRLHCEELNPENRKRVFKKGWVRGYDTIFTEAFKIPFADGPVPIAVLEDIVLTRNRIQHDLEITTNRPKHADRKPGAAPSVFLDAQEVELLDRLHPDAKTWLAPPTVHVSQASLEATRGHDRHRGALRSVARRGHRREAIRFALRSDGPAGPTSDAVPTGDADAHCMACVARLQSGVRLSWRDRVSGMTETGFRGYCRVDDEKRMGSLRVGPKTDTIAGLAPLS